MFVIQIVVCNSDAIFIPDCFLNDDHNSKQNFIHYSDGIQLMDHSRIGHIFVIWILGSTVYISGWLPVWKYGLLKLM